MNNKLRKRKQRECGFFKVLILMMAMLGYGMSSNAQITITGTVTDENNEPMIGITIAVKNSTIGTATDIDGKYSLTVPNSNAVIVYSYIGYERQEIPVGSRKVIDVKLKENTKLLDEVVVVGFGTQKKINLTGSVATVDSKMLENRPITNVSAGLAGLLPGVTITQKSGLPGGDGGTIRVRGVGTLNNANPMVLVDGVEATMDNIDPNDIETLTVLKDAASSAIFGAKAANGVILITTKKGKAGKSQVNYSGNFGWQTPTALPKYIRSAEYAEMYNEALKNDGKSLKFTEAEIQKFRDGSDPDNFADTDWQDLLYQGSGFQTNHSVNVSGGTDKARYMTSVGYLQQDGVIKLTGKKQYNIRTNLDINPISKLDVGVNLSYTRMDLEEATNSYVGGGADQIFRQVNLISPWIPYRKSNGDYGTISDGNPIAWIDLGQQILKKRAYFLGIGTIKYELIKDLSLKGVFSYKTFTEDQNEFIKDIQYNPYKYQGPNKMHQRDYSNETVASDIFLNYSKSFNRNHNFIFLGGFHSEYYHYKYTYAYRENFPSNNLSDLNGGSTAGMKNEGYTRELAMLSWFGRLNYDYAGKYLFEANFRYDGSSRFAEANRWGFFPSFSGAWRISEESFMEPLRNSITNLKVRASWGKLGNQAALDDYYPTIPTLSLKDQDYAFGGKIVPGGATIYAKNPNLKWEETRTWNIGLDVGITSDLNITVDYYDKLTSDILMKVPTPDTYALEDFWDNVGEVSNKGIEFSAQYNKQFKNVMFSFGGNIAYNKNKILKLAGQNEIIDGKDIKRVGNSLNSIYGYKTDGLYQSKEDINNWPTNNIQGTVVPGDLRYVDVSGDGVLSAADRVIIGCTDPKFVFGFNVGATYRGFDMLLFFQGTAGGKGYMESEAIGELNGDNGKPTTFWRNRWTPENTNTDIPRLSSQGKSGPSMPSVISSYWLQDGTYLRLKNLQVGYTLPAKLTHNMQISKVRVFYSAQNLLTFTSFVKGWDPESPVGRGSHYPQVMVNSFGINVTF